MMIRNLIIEYEPLFQIGAYAMLMGLVHGLVVVGAALLATPVLFVCRRKYWMFLRGFAVFNALLLVCGTVANLLWDRFIFGNVYVSTDYVFDFTPFLPITQAWVDAPWGNQTGAIYQGLNILHVQIIWFAFAFATWMTAIYLYERVRRFWTRKEDIDRVETTFRQSGKPVGSRVTFAMKIMKRIPTILTAIHGGFSLLLLGISHSMPLGGIGYFAALTAFIINLPGILTIRQFYTSSSNDGLLSVWVGSFGMILITDIYLFLFLTIICLIIGRMKNSANNRVETTTLPR